LNVLQNALQGLIDMFADQNSKVREALAWVFQRLCDHHADVISDPQVTPLVMPRIIESLKDKPRISNQCCAAIERLAIGCAPLNEEPSNCLTQYMQEII